MRCRPRIWGYMATGVDDDATLKANREGFKRFQLRPRRLVDVSHASTETELFGTAWDAPIFLCPCSYHKAFHPEGEVATARAAQTGNTQMILSNQTTTSVEEVIKARGKPVWFQRYAASRWDATEKMVKRAETAGCPVLVVTIDQQGGRDTETQQRLRRLDTRNCGACHDGGG